MVGIYLECVIEQYPVRDRLGDIGDDGVTWKVKQEG